MIQLIAQSPDTKPTKGIAYQSIYTYFADGKAGKCTLGPPNTTVTLGAWHGANHPSSFSLFPTLRRRHMSEIP